MPVTACGIRALRQGRGEEASVTVYHMRRFNAFVFTELRGLSLKLSPFTRGTHDDPIDGSAA
jgi:hypothetical protein